MVLEAQWNMFSPIYIYDHVQVYVRIHGYVFNEYVQITNA